VDGSAPRSKKRNGRRPVRLTERDLMVLGFVAEHRLVIADHVVALTDRSRSTASARLRALVGAGFLREERVFDGHRPCFLITSKGLNVIGSVLPAPRIDLRAYTHDIGLAWLWLAARSGSFGALDEIHGERRLRSRDAAADRADQPLGVRLGGFGPHGRERLHYPDLLLIAPDRRRIALELELSWKGRRRREDIMTGYAFDNRISAVLYFVEDRRLGSSILDSARRLGISARVHVQPVWVTVRAPGAASIAASRVRRGTRSRGTPDRSGARGRDRGAELAS
jgi:hypothetical protein